MSQHGKQRGTHQGILGYIHLMIPLLLGRELFPIFDQGQVGTPSILPVG